MTPDAPRLIGAEDLAHQYFVASALPQLYPFYLRSTITRKG
jgi:hypothetical protein